MLQLERTALLQIHCLARRALTVQKVVPAIQDTLKLSIKTVGKEEEGKKQDVSTEVKLKENHNKTEKIKSKNKEKVSKKC